MLVSSMVVALTVLSAINVAHAAEAPAPSPASPAAVISPSVASGFLAMAVALVFGSALRIWGWGDHFVTDGLFMKPIGAAVLEI